MRPLRTVFSLGLIVWFVFGLIPAALPRGAAAQGTAPSFEPGTCPFDVPATENVTCGMLTVPEDRSQSGGATIRLAVAVLHSPSAAPAPDPIVYLEGGPGGGPLMFASDWFDSPLRDTRDIVLLDQRGTGFSEPGLDCPELDQLTLDTLDDNLTPDQDVALQTEAAQRCHDRLAAEGVQVTDYNSAENAADVADLRVALGYDEWNLYGISYGTRLALTILRDHPEGVRSVVIDSVYPPQANGYTELVPNAVRAFNQLFQGCAEDPKCAAAYPDLEQVFYQQVDRLNADPVLVPTTHPFTGKSYNLLLTGDALIEMVFGSLYAAEIIPYLPFLIYQVKDGDYQATADVAMILFVQSEFISEGMYYSVECQEELPFNNYDQMIQSADAYPEFKDFILTEADYPICALWGAGTAGAVENEPVRSDIPTLVLSGQYDPITPPAWGQLAAQALSHSYFFEFPGLGHGVSVSADCPLQIVVDFINDPTTAPDASCINAMRGPDFLAP